MHKTKILFIVKNKNEASSRFRVFSYLNQLDKDFDVSFFYAEYNNKSVPKFLRSLIKRFRFFFLLYLACRHDILFMQRPMSSDKSKSTFFEKLLVKVNPNLIFDFDDALFVQNEDKIRSLISLSKACICGNEYLANFTNKINSNTHIIPTPIDTDKFTSAIHDEPTKLTIGWTGTSGNYAFFTERLIQDIQTVLEENPNIRFLFICDKKPDERFTFAYDFIQWDADTEVEDLRKIDIGLMPLIESPWTKGKCGFKLIQYGTISIPSIASDVGVNSEVVLDKKSGFIIKNDLWKDSLEKLINDADLRRSMGTRAREHIEKVYSVKENYPKLKSTLENLVPERI